MTWSPTPPPRSRPGEVPPAVPHVPASPPSGGGPGRRIGRTGLLIAVCVAAAVALAFVAGRQVEAQSDAHRSSSTLTTRERTSDIGRALARSRNTRDLPLGYQAGPDLPYPGDSYRLLYDAEPHAPVRDDRWRLWAGEGVDSSELCLVAAFSDVQEVVDCYPASLLLSGTFTVASPVGNAPLAVRVVAGDVTVNGHRVPH